MAGVALSLFGKEDASTTNSYPMATAYAKPATTRSSRAEQGRPGVNAMVPDIGRKPLSEVVTYV